MRLLITLTFLLTMNCSFGQKAQQNVLKGDSLLDSKNYSAALICFKLAASEYESTANTNEAIVSNNKAALCYSRLGQFDEAKSLLTSNLKLLQNTSKNKIEEANTLKLLGEIELNTANYDQAKLLFEREQALFTDNNNKQTRAANLSNLGLVSDQLGNHDAAIEYLQQALILQKQTNNTLAIADTYNNLGLVLSADNDKKALEMYQNALSIYAKEVGTTHGSYINTNNNIAILYRRLNEPDKALKIFETTLATWLNTYGNDHPSVAFTYSNMAQVYLDFNMPDIALSYEEKALSIYKKTYGTNHPELANTYNHIANIQRSQKNYGAALINIQQSLIANCKEFTSTNLSQNPTPKQVAYSRQLLAITLHVKAQLFADLHFKKTLKQSDLKQAFATLEACDKVIEEQRHFLKNKKDKLALGTLSKEVNEDAIKITLAMADNSVTHKAEYLKLAFLYAEKSKASVLLESMNDANAKSFANLPKSILVKEKELINAINQLDQQLALGGTNELQLRQKLLSLTNEHNTLVLKLEKEYPDYYNLKYNIKMTSVEEIQHTLQTSEMMLSYLISEENRRLYIFRISKNDFDVVNTALPTNLNNNITGLRNGIFYQSDKDYVLAATRLHHQLFPKRLPHSTTKLIIIPDGRLGVIPFEALLTKPVKAEAINYSTLPYLINEFAISYNFSATLYQQNKAKKELTTNPSIVLTAPVSFDKGSTLPGTKKEVNEIEKAFKNKNCKTFKLLEEDASETTIKSDEIKNYDILHFATHGVVDERTPQFSQLFLKKDSKNDGNLFTSEIYELELKASLVNLSACETGLGQYSKGEGIVGLSRALIFAGAKNLIVSYWSVADESTSDLMISFYNEHLKGLTYDTSIKTAKQQLIANPSFNKPYYWAPFVLIGE